MQYSDDPYCFTPSIYIYSYIARPEQLINLIFNRDYWEIIDVQTIAMSISYILSKEIPSETLTRL